MVGCWKCSTTCKRKLKKTNQTILFLCRVQNNFSCLLVVFFSFLASRYNRHTLSVRPSIRWLRYDKVSNGGLLDSLLTELKRFTLWQEISYPIVTREVCLAGNAVIGVNVSAPNRVFRKYCVFLQDFQLNCLLPLASTRLLLRAFRKGPADRRGFTLALCWQL